MKVTKDQVEEALSSFEETLSKASDTDLDQPEGDDLGEGEEARGKKMSDFSPKPGKAEKSLHAKKGGKIGGQKAPAGHDSEEHEEEEHGEDMHDEQKSRKSHARKSYMDADHVDESETHSDHKGKPSGKPYGAKGDDHEKHEREEHGEDMHDEQKSRRAKKSFTDDMPEEIQTKIDVSEFLKSLVDHTGDCIDELAERVVKSEGRIAKSYESVMDAVEDLQKSQAKIGIVLKAICQRIGIIENAPARTAKSETTVAKGGQATERKMASGLEGEGAGEPVFKGLSPQPHVAKSQMSEALCQLVRKGEAQDLDVIGFETNGFVRPELLPKLKAIFQ